MRRGEHLPAQAGKEQVQGVPRTVLCLCNLLATLLCRYIISAE